MATISTDGTVFVLDDSDDFRSSTVWLLKSMGYNVEDFSDHVSAIDRLKMLGETEVAVLLLDVPMPAMDGPDVHDLINRLGIVVPMVYMTAHSELPIVVDAMSKGAITFLEKPLDQKKLTDAMNSAFSESVQIRRGIKANEDESVRTRKGLKKLTPRESQVIQGLLGDMTNKEIANTFKISTKTVELHRARVMSKLGAKNAAHLVRMVMTCAPN